MSFQPTVFFTIFQSTRSARSATRDSPEIYAQMQISIHALREERDAATTPITITTIVFQSTRSARSATRRGWTIEAVAAISIHALREERDSCI